MHLGRVFGVLAVAVGAALPVLGQQKTADNPIINPPAGQAIPATQNVDIKWTPTTKDGTISLVLVKGAAGNLQEVLKIASGQINNGFFKWSPPATLQGLQTMAGDQGYAIKIIDDKTKNFNEGGLFKLDNPNSTFNTAAASSAKSTAAGATTASSAQTSPSAQSTPPATTPTSAATSTPPATTSLASSVLPTTLSTSTQPPTTTPTSSTAPSITETPAATTSSSSTPASSDTAEKSTTTASASPTAAPAKKVKTVTIVGIAAGVVVVVVAIVVGAILFMRRKRVDRESKMFGGTDPRDLRNSGYKPQTSYDSEFAMMERQRPYGEFRETGAYGSQPQPEHIGMARF